MIPIRNNLSHANPISMRQAERAVCYTNDFIDCLKEYYKKENAFMSFNVPQIIKVVDSFGQERYRESIYNDTASGLIWTRTDIDNLRPGDTYRLDIEIDPSFDPNDYEIEWRIANKIEEFRNKKYFYITFDNSHIAELFTIYCKITSKKSWHKYTYFDDKLTVSLKVLPPLGE